MITVRLFFYKRDRAKYISHLDITRAFARALARTTLPLWHTEGFNPRIYMTFALPIPLGFESGCESMDIKLLQEDFPLEQVTEQLNRVLPQGLHILETVLPIHKAEAIARADYILEVESAQPEALGRRFEAFAAQPAIPIIRHTKKGDKAVDLAPLLALRAWTAEEEALRLELRLAAGTTLNLNPMLLMEAFSVYVEEPLTDYRVERTALLTETDEIWR